MAVNLQHIRDAQRSNPRLVALCGIALAFYSACGDAVDNRFDRQRDLGSLSYGNDNRLVTSTSPGVIESATLGADAWDVNVWASAPFPMVTFANGEFETRVLRVNLRNVDSGLALPVRVGPLGAGRRRDTRCLDSEYAEQPQVLLAPLEPEVRGLDGLTVSVRIPPCTEVVLDTAPSPLTDVYRIAVFGAGLDNRERLDEAVRAAVASGAEHVVFLGNLVSAAGSPGALRTILQGGGFTIGITPGRAEVVGDWEAFQDSFGQTDFESRIGAMRLLFIDSASGRLTDGQFELLESLGRTPGPGLLLTHLPPLDGHGVSEESWVSMLQAGRALAALDRAEVGTLVTSSRPEHVVQQRSGFEMVQIGQVNARGVSPRLLLVEIVRPVPGLATCVGGDDCGVGEECVDSLCQLPCVQDAGCPGTRPVCDAERGVCRVACDDGLDCPLPGPECGADNYCVENTRLQWRWQSY
jgi:hypothetical protein